MPPAMAHLPMLQRFDLGIQGGDKFVGNFHRPPHQQRMRMQSSPARCHRPAPSAPDGLIQIGIGAITAIVLAPPKGWKSLAWGDPVE